MEYLEEQEAELIEEEYDFLEEERPSFSQRYPVGQVIAINEQASDNSPKPQQPQKMYRHGGSADPRPHHLAWDKLVLRADNPWWQVNYPPNGWGCSCNVMAVSEATARRLGGRFEDPPANQPGDIDPGWEHAPGADVAQEIRNLVQQKQVDLPGVLARAFTAEILSRFGDWLDQ